MNRQFLLVFILLAAFYPTLWSQTKDAELDQKRSRVKAVQIYKIIDQVYWPGQDDFTEFSICVVGSSNVAEWLKKIAALRKFKDRCPIKVYTTNSVAGIKNCQMLVVDAKSNVNLWEMYKKIKGKPVLMVAENLGDYKQSMISFFDDGNNIKFIINKTKVAEANLVVNQRLYDAAITKEGEWRSIVEKFENLLKTGKEADASDVKQMLSMYKTLEEEKKDKELMMARLTDSLNIYLAKVEASKREEEQVKKNIEEQSRKVAELDKKIIESKAELSKKLEIIGEKDNVIIVITALSVLGIILLLFTIRSNNQRRKANKLLLEQKSEIERQKNLVDEKQKEILDSINYAKRIQTALMANAKVMNDHLPEHFVFFRPKDIVAGDFYWAAPVSDGFVYITADSTGHGVPGAFMSLLNISKLNDAINQKVTRPDLVLNEVKTGIIKALNPEGSSEESKDGMDAVLCKLDHKNMKLQFAAANNSFCIIRNKNIITCKADKMPVGKSHDDNGKFSFNEILLEKGDMIFTFTDGYGDQFGGPEGKKFKHKKLRDIFAQVSEMPINKQKEIIANTFESWKGELEQVDDVLVIGVRV